MDRIGFGSSSVNIGDKKHISYKGAVVVPKPTKEEIQQALKKAKQNKYK